MHPRQRGESGSCRAIVAALGVGLALGAASARAAVTVVENDKGKLDVELGGMFSASTSGQDSAPDQKSRVYDFALRRVRVTANATASKWLSLTLQVGQDNVGSKIATEDTGFKIKDAYANLKSRDELQLAVGQFKVPFLRINLEGDLKGLLIDRPLASALRPAREISRDIGAMLWGNYQGLQYRLGLFDGADQDQKNSTSSPRLSGRAVYNFYSLEKGLSYTGTSVGEERVFQVGGDFDWQNDRLDARDDKDYVAQSRDYRAGAVEVYYDQPFKKTWAATIEAAWVGRHDDYNDPTLAQRKVRGYYVQGGVLLPGKVGPGRVMVDFRNEYTKGTRGAATTEIKQNALGGTWFVKGQSRKLMIDYTWRREDPKELDNDELKAAFVAVF